MLIFYVLHALRSNNKTHHPQKQDAAVAGETNVTVPFYGFYYYAESKTCLPEIIFFVLKVQNS